MEEDLEIQSFLTDLNDDDFDFVKYNEIEKDINQINKYEEIKKDVNQFEDDLSELNKDSKEIRLDLNQPIKKDIKQLEDDLTELNKDSKKIRSDLNQPINKNIEQLNKDLKQTYKINIDKKYQELVRKYKKDNDKIFYKDLLKIIYKYYIKSLKKFKQLLGMKIIPYDIYWMDMLINLITLNNNPIFDMLLEDCGNFDKKYLMMKRNYTEELIFLKKNYYENINIEKLKLYLLYLENKFINHTDKNFIINTSYHENHPYFKEIVKYYIKKNDITKEDIESIQHNLIQYYLENLIDYEYNYKNINYHCVPFLENIKECIKLSKNVLSNYVMLLNMSLKSKENTDFTAKIYLLSLKKVFLDIKQIKLVEKYYVEKVLVKNINESIDLFFKKETKTVDDIYKNIHSFNQNELTSRIRNLIKDIDIQFIPYSMIPETDVNLIEFN